MSVYFPSVRANWWKLGMYCSTYKMRSACNFSLYFQKTVLHRTWNGVHETCIVELRCIDRSPCVLIVLIREHCLAASNLYSSKFANKCSSSSPSVPSTLFFPYLVVFHSIRWKHKIKEQERARERGALLLRTVAHHGVCTAACSNVLVLREPGGGS
jgi:hypothetical protein